MNMSEKQDITLPIPGVSDAPGVDDVYGVVPVTPSSSSYEGLSVVLPTGITPKLATAEVEVARASSVSEEPQSTPGEDVAATEVADGLLVQEKTQIPRPPLDETPKSIIIEDEKFDNASQISEGASQMSEDMTWETMH